MSVCPVGRKCYFTCVRWQFVVAKGGFKGKGFVPSVRVTLYGAPCVCLEVVYASGGGTGGGSYFFYFFGGYGFFI